MGFGILKRIDISPAFVAFLCAYYYFDPLKTFVPFLISAALHETGHLAALFCCRVKIHSIKVRMSGAQIVTEPIPYFKELLVTISGPAVNFALFLIFQSKDPLMAFLNFCLVGYNLLPVYPLDGGRAINALLHILLPQRIAEAIARMISAVCLCCVIGVSCYLTCVWHAGLWPVIVSGILLLRLGEMFLKETRNFAHL